MDTEKERSNKERPDLKMVRLPFLVLKERGILTFFTSHFLLSDRTDIK